MISKKIIRDVFNLKNIFRSHISDKGVSSCCFSSVMFMLLDIFGDFRDPFRLQFQTLDLSLYYMPTCNYDNLCFNFDKK